MAYVSESRSAHAHVSFLGDVFESVREALQRRRLYNETVRELSQLSSRELADLQLNRSLIRSVAYEAAYGRF